MLSPYTVELILLRKILVICECFIANVMTNLVIVLIYVFYSVDLAGLLLKEEVPRKFSNVHPVQ